MSKVLDVVNLARIDLNDDDKTRWDDLELLKHFNAALRLVYQLRPDLRLGGFASSLTDKKLSDELPSSVADYARGIADFIVARANGAETDDADLNRASVFMTSFRGMLGVG